MRAGCFSLDFVVSRDQLLEHVSSLQLGICGVFEIKTHLLHYATFTRPVESRGNMQLESILYEYPLFWLQQKTAMKFLVRYLLLYE